MARGWCFQFDWRFALLLAVLLPTMLSLGFWQLRRAEENRQLQVEADRQRAVTPMLLDAAVQADIRLQLLQDSHEARRRWHLQQLTLQGRWRSEVLLLESQLHEGRNGYHVLGVLDVDGGAVLVNRGWIAAPASRAELPVIPVPVAGMQETGELYMPSHIYPDEAVFAEPGWPKRIGRLQLPGIARESGLDILPAVVRLREHSPSALTAQWPVVNIAPEKNTAYAIQWFAMSVALVLCYLAVSFSRSTGISRE